MTLQDRDKRALIVFAPVLLIALIYWLAGSSGGSTPKIAAPAADGVALEERRLTELRKSLATVDGKEALLRQASAELAEREKGLIPGDTAEQAQAQLLQIVRRVARAQAPPIEIRQSELGQPRPYGDAYGQVTVSMNIDCRIDELVNLLAALSEQPEIIATEELRFGSANAKSKAMPVRLTVSGIVPHRLLPKKGPATGGVEL